MAKKHSFPFYSNNLQRFALKRHHVLTSNETCIHLDLPISYYETGASRFFTERSVVKQSKRGKGTGPSVQTAQVPPPIYAAVSLDNQLANAKGYQRHAVAQRQIQAGFTPPTAVEHTTTTPLEVHAVPQTI